MHISERSDYKKTWERLAGTEYTAFMNVAGHDNIDEFERSARVTVGVLGDTVKILPSDTFLEIGCGVGRVGKELSPRVKKWIGTDISAGMITLAEKYLSGSSNVELKSLEQPNLKQFPDESVDVVYCTVVFMHLYEWDRYQYVKEAFRVLKPGGRCYFDNVDITTDHGWEVFTNSCNYPVGERPSSISMVSSSDELEVYGKRAGFGNIRMHRWGAAWIALVGEKPKSPTEIDH